MGHNLCPAEAACKGGRARAKLNEEADRHARQGGHARDQTEVAVWPPGIDTLWRTCTMRGIAMKCSLPGWNCPLFDRMYARPAGRLPSFLRSTCFHSWLAWMKWSRFSFPVLQC